MFTKSLFALSIAFFSYFVSAQQNNPSAIQWKTIQEALNMAQNEKKPVFIDFYTSWCSWCVRMDQTTFKDSSVVKVLNQDFIPVKFNAEGSDSISYKGKVYTNPNPGVARSTHYFTFAILGQRVGYPSFALLDENNNLVIIAPGYQQPSQLLSVLRFVKTKAYATQSWDEWTKQQTAQ